ncbi:Canalicular multispecific organic anion transporter 2 [Gonapodya sp. JEL0774]|nr:Canalicular multispecific organic anion transporter 2 [Gonapodya sp. JEL0774]
MRGAREAVFERDSFERNANSDAGKKASVSLSQHEEPSPQITFLTRSAVLLFASACALVVGRSESSGSISGSAFEDGSWCGDDSEGWGPGSAERVAVLLLIFAVPQIVFFLTRPRFPSSLSNRSTTFGIAVGSPSRIPGSGLFERTRNPHRAGTLSRVARSTRKGLLYWFKMLLLLALLSTTLSSLLLSLLLHNNRLDTHPHPPAPAVLFHLALQTNVLIACAVLTYVEHCDAYEARKEGRRIPRATAPSATLLLGYAAWILAEMTLARTRWQIAGTEGNGSGAGDDQGKPASAGVIESCVTLGVLLVVFFLENLDVRGVVGMHSARTNGASSGPAPWRPLSGVWVDGPAADDEEEADEERRPLITDTEGEPNMNGHGVEGEKDKDEKEDGDEHMGSPDEEATVWEVVTFGWLSPLMLLGYSRILTPPDLPSLNRRNISSATATTLLRHWRNELARWDGNVDLEGVTVVRGPWYRRVFCLGGVRPIRPQPSLFRALTRSFGGQFMFAAIFKLGNDISTFAMPPLLGMLIGFANSRLSGKPEAEQQPIANGVLISLGMFTLVTLQSIFVHQYFQTVIVAGIRLRTAVCSAVYRKALVLSPGERAGSTTGEIVNLMSADGQRIANVLNYLHMVWSAPLQIAIALTLLYRQLGPSIFGGVVMMLAATPINVMVARLRKKFEEETMELRDERVKVMDELLNGIKVVKLYAWEKLFMGKVEKVRNDELNLRKRLAGLSAALYMTWSSTPFFVSLAAFGLYSFLETAPLTSTKIFVSLSLFNLLTFPLVMLPNVVSGMVQANVSMGRVQRFLLSDEIDRDAVERVPAPVVDGRSRTSMVTVEDGTFAWSLKPITTMKETGITVDKDHSANVDNPATSSLPATPDGKRQRSEKVKPVLSSINFTVHSGECVAVVGRVGAGKSSIVSAVLGEMKKIAGRVEVRGKVAYVSQVAWIMNASLRDNVIFGNEWDEEWYNKVIDACALRSDFKILPGGDDTEIGERGINLSGGQKQRVSLARAVYSRADVYLLDDPLSAVDSHVGRHIFEQVVGKDGLLGSKARLFVTHGINFLPECDTILMVQDGKIIAQGEHHELLARSAPARDEREASSSSQSWSYAELVRDLEVEKREHEAAEEDLGGETEREEDDESEEELTDASEEPLKDSGPKPIGDRRKSSSDLKLKLHQAEAQAKALKDLEAMKKIIQKEELRTGSVSVATYLTYAKACGYGNIVLYLLLATIQQIFALGGSVWLADWSKAGDRGEGTESPVWRIGVFAGLGMCQVLFTMFQQLALNILCAIRAAWQLHSRMLQNVVYCPQSFFDQTPTGRILNRFAKDIELVDETVPAMAGGVVWDVLVVFSVLIIDTWVTPTFGLFVVSFDIMIPQFCENVFEKYWLA